MAENFTNNYRKHISDNVITPVRIALQVIDSLRSQTDALNKSILQKELLFAKQKQEKDVQKQPEEQIVEKPQQKVDKLEQAEQKVETVVVQPVAVEQKQETKPEPQVEIPPKQVEVSETVSDDIKIKTYTDDKGNVKVRKFLDVRPTQPKQQSKKTFNQQQGDQNKKQRPFVKDNNNQKSFNKQDKDSPSNGAKQQPQQKQKSIAPSFIPADLPKANTRKNTKSKSFEKSDEKFSSKKALITKSFNDYDEDRYVRSKAKKKSEHKEVEVKKIEHAIVNTQDIPLKVLSEKIGVTVAEIIKQLFKEGVMKTINDSVDFDYAEYVAGLFGVTLELKLEESANDILDKLTTDDGLEDTEKRAPIVTVMGHVDHGKTSLLDAIRKTNVTQGEAGGITQHIGAYTVKARGEQITFIDTPGHAAFTQMRARGAKITDVAIIVVAADDGVMPQTIEAINHAKAAGVQIVVAINKIDRNGANPDRVKQQLTEFDLVTEEWGGNTIMVPVSAKTGQGIDTLLESVLLVTEIKELKANTKKKATGTILEARIEKGRGVVATVLVANGTLRTGDNIIAGFSTGKVKAMFDDKGKKIQSAGPSMPVEVLGFSEVPVAGDAAIVADEKLVKKAAEERKDRLKVENARMSSGLSLNDLFGKISEGELKILNLIVKTDVQGSYEVIKQSLEEISNEEVKVAVIHGGVGAINETDVMLASASSAIIIGFNVRLDAKVAAEKEKVDVRIFNVIYDAVDTITKAVKGLLAPKFTETVIGSAIIRNVFKISGVGTVAGCYVNYGKITRNGKVRVYRNDTKIFEGNIGSLKRFNDEVKEVAYSYECGVTVENYDDLKVDDVFEIYQVEEINE